MRRKLSLLIAFVGVLGLLGLAPTADATHDIKDGQAHDGESVPTAPDPILGGTCVVSGEVDVGNAAGNGGVAAAEQNHNHFRFQETTINCVNVPSGNDVSAFEGEYEVDASGGTDGPTDEITGVHGEDDAEGWSHKACYADRDCETELHGDKGSFTDIYDGINTNGTNGCANCGEITAEQVGGTVQAGTVPDSQGDNDGVGPDSESWVKFHRQGSLVEAWGALVGTAPAAIAGNVLCFNAVLDFIPNNTDTNTNKTTGAFLEGEATIWTANAKSDCADTKGSKK